MNDHFFNISGRTFKLTCLQMIAIIAFMKLIPCGGSNGSKVRAIKFAREQLSIGLKEAKDLCDLIEMKAYLTQEGYIEMNAYRQTVEYLGTTPT
jgi:hypothetical protein